MTSIVKQTRVRHTFGGEDATGWVPPNTPRPPRTPEQTVDLLVQIERVDDGFILEWIGPEAMYSGDYWYVELRFAEHAAEELFGISPEQWEAVA